LIRGIRTFAQTFIAMIGTATLLDQINWLNTFSASGLAFLLSILTSIATGLPEVDNIESKESKEG